MFNKRLFLTKRRRRSNRFLNLKTLVESLNPVSGFSISRRFSSIVDKLIRVRRASDNSELDIGFKNKVLDTQALINFGGASDCFVTTWYDQIGSNHATQSTATNQPKIYDGVTRDVTRENGKPAMVFNGAGNHLSIPNVAGRSNIDVYFVNRHDDTSATAIDNEVYLYPTGNGAGNFGFVGMKNSTTGTLNSASYGSPSLYKNNLELFPANRGEVYSLLGQTQNIVNHRGASTSSWTEYQYGRYDSGQGVFHFEGTLQEIIIFDNNLTPDNRQKLHDDINDHYGIF